MPVTYEEMQKSLQELRDVQLVQAHLMDRHEHEWNERFSRLADAVERHEDGIAELRAAMTRLFERMDRFIQGLERENGRK